MTMHTPGPWTQAQYAKCEILASDETMIATAREGLNGVTREQAIANAALIAAAPELLAALKLALPLLKGHQETPERKARYEAAIAAIAKAGGSV